MPGRGSGCLTSFCARRAAQTGAAFVPFDLKNDYRRYVDGKPRIAGVASFLAARGITVSTGAPGDQAEQETAHELASRKDHYFAELLTHEGVDVSASAESLLHEARRRGMRTAVASSSHHCAEILRTAGLTALFDARVDGVDLDRLVLPGKPAPDIFLEAARRLNVVPPRAAVFEDAAAASKRRVRAISAWSSGSDPQPAHRSCSSMEQTSS